MITFQQALDSIDSSVDCSILLANGFSQAWNRDIFNYKSLLQSANFGARDSVVRSIFAKFDTYDFEKIMNRLIATETILTLYDANSSLLGMVREDQDIIKEALITAISQTHPGLPRDVSDAQYVAVRKFLSRFHQVFTLNYDLLFYWARNKTGLEPLSYDTDDGFRANQTWKGPVTQNVHFLHGGLHIYDTVAGVKKHVCTDDGESIIDQVRSNMEGKRFPTFVAEPTHQKKRSRILHNPYLNFCFQKLGLLKGVVFVYGHSLDENDKHIFDQIIHSGVHKVFVSVYGDEHSEQNMLAQGRARAYLGEHKVEFFKAESAPVWL